MIKAGPDRNCRRLLARGDIDAYLPLGAVAEPTRQAGRTIGVGGDEQQGRSVRRPDGINRCRGGSIRRTIGERARQSLESPGTGLEIVVRDRRGAAAAGQSVHRDPVRPDLTALRTWRTG